MYDCNTTQIDNIVVLLKQESYRRKKTNFLESITKVIIG